FTIALFWAATALPATIPTVSVANPGNPADFRYYGVGYGAVPYSFNIAQREVTNAQYTEFLNAVAASDPYALYSTSMASDTRGGIIRSGAVGNYTYSVKPPALNGSYGYDNKPVVFVSWFDAIRFANWMNNGQGNADTEDGAYTLLGGTATPSNADSITRNP